jgi:hypothetical protein
MTGSMRCDERIRAPKPNREILLSIIEIANGRLLASGFEKLTRLYCDLARKAEDRRITRELANNLCLLSG